MAQLKEKLITFAYFKDEVDLPQNIDDAEFDHKIYRAQERLRMLMGDEFYQDFISNYKAKTLSADYQKLLDPYIKQFIARQAFAFWTITSNFKPTRAGYRVHSEENSEAVSTEDMGIIIKDAKQECEYYAKLLVEFMNGNSSLYPLYNSGCNNVVGNTFYMSAVKKTHHHHCTCRKCQ